VSLGAWLEQADRRLGQALVRRPAPAVGAAVATAGLGVLVRCLEAGACASESFHRRHVRGARARFLFRTEDGALASHLVLDGAELRAGMGDAGRPDDADWDVVVVFRDAASICGLLRSGSPDVVLALVQRRLRVCGNLALLYKLGFMLSDLGARVGWRPGGAP